MKVDRLPSALAASSSRPVPDPWRYGRRTRRAIHRQAEHADLVAARPRTDEIAVAIGGRVVLADEVSAAERELVALPTEAGTVSTLAFDESGKRLAIATSEGGVAVFDVDRGFAALPVRLGVEISSLALTDSGELWISDRDGVRSYAAADGRPIRVLADARAPAASRSPPIRPSLAWPWRRQKVCSSSTSMT